jgi:hypothetical protein
VRGDKIVLASINMSHRGDAFEDNVKQRSGWLIPIAVFVVTAALSAIILLFYIAPAPTSFIEQHASPTSRTDVVLLSVGGFQLAIPANYLLYRNQRLGGAQDKAELYTSYPEFRGYSDSQAQVFADNGADSPVVYLLIRQEQFDIDEAARLQRIYLNYVIDPAGTPGPFGLTQFRFRDDSGYRGEDLFVGQTPLGPVVMHCVRLSSDVPSPSCLRDERLARGVALSYRFKRTQLVHWREIAQGVDALVRSFRKPTK